MSRKRTLNYYKRHYPEHFHLFYNLANQKADHELRHEIVSKFWSFMPAYSDGLPNLYEPLMNAVEFLHSNGTRCTDIQSQILSSVPHHSNIYILKTYSQAFKAYLNLAERLMPGSQYDDDDETERYMVGQALKKCQGCDAPVDSQSCVCQSIYDRFRIMNDQLRELDLLNQLVGDAVISVLSIFIEKKIRNKCVSDLRSSFINELNTWVGDTATSWIHEIYGTRSTPRNHASMYHGKESIALIEQRLNFFLCHTYADIRVEQLFDIIIDYPASDAAIQDLKDYLDHSASPNFKKSLVHSLRSSFTSRLLIPGVTTFDILTTYILAIKALRALDPCGLILHLATEPVRRYLKSREDTVRCIITALTDKEHSELNKEMIKSSSQVSDENCDGSSSDDWQTWQPDPIDIGCVEDMDQVSRSSDIISTLVNIYESKDFFVEEYQKQLGYRLLSRNCDAENLDTELKNLELLTIKFSDCELHRCEVMLRDIKTSNRMNKRITEGDVEGCDMSFKNFKAIIVSSPFWPDKFGLQGELNDDAPNVKFPSEIEKAISTYTTAYETIQGSRTLCWKHHLGQVNLGLEIGGREYEFNVTPLHASIIYHFENRDTWRLSELAQDMNLPVTTLKQKLQLWIDRGILDTTNTDMYHLIADPSSRRAGSLDDTEGNPMSADISNPDMSQELGQSAPTNVDVDDSGFAILWPFIRNMLLNVNSMALSRIHTLAKQFARGEVSHRSDSEPPTLIDEGVEAQIKAIIMSSTEECKDLNSYLKNSPDSLNWQGGLIGPFGPPAGPNRLIGGNLYGTTGGTMPLGPVAIPNAMMEEIRRRQFEVGSGPQGPPSGSNQGGVMPLTPSSTTSVANQLDMPSKNNLMMWPTVSLNQSMFPSQTGTAPYPSSAGGQLNRTKLSLASV
ncbi:Anaphase-promoting complex subunit 2, partial [Fragariocoptes setiger]